MAASIVKLAILLSGSALGWLIGALSPGLAQTPTTQLTVGGQVNASRTFGLQDLQALPAQTQTVSFLSGASSTTATFTGPSLWSLLNETVGLRIDPTTRNDILRSAVIATGSDGYQAVYTAASSNGPVRRRKASPNGRRR